MEAGTTMYKIFSIIILTTILIVTGAVTGMASWQLTLEVSTHDPNSDTVIATNRLTTGTDPTATDSYDNKLDIIALLDGPVLAYFPHIEYPIGQQKLWRDFRAESFPKEWEIEIQSSTNNTVSLSWNIDAPANLNFTLIDTGSNQETPMISSNTYSYSNPTGIPKKFLLKAAENTTTGASGSETLNMIILFTPLIWLSIKRIVFSESIVYVRKDGKEIFGSFVKKLSNSSKLKIKDKNAK